MSTGPFRIREARRADIETLADFTRREAREAEELALEAMGNIKVSRR